MEALFSSVPEALDNTVKIAERCNVEFEFGHTILPNFDTPNDQDHFEYFRNMCYEGLIKKYHLECGGKLLKKEEINMVLMEQVTNMYL